MEKASRRLLAILWALVGLALVAPVIWFSLYRAAHPDASIGPELIVFFALIGFFGLQIALRSLWTAVRGV